MRSPRPWAAELALGLAAAAVLVGPAWWRGEPVGSAGAEAPGHLWVQAWAAAGWPTWPTGTDLVSGAGRWPVIDPLPTWLAAGAARLVGPTAAWNGLWSGWVVLAAVGGGALARAAGGVGLVGAAGLAFAPIWLGSLASGLTEDGAIGLLAVALALLVSGRPRAGGAALGVLAWCGLYLAWLGAAAALVVGLARARRDGMARWVVGAIVAGALAAPAALPFAARLGGDSHRSGSPPVVDEPRWRVNPVRRADLAAFVAPGAEPAGPGREHPTYVGWAPIALAAADLHPALGGAALLAGVALDRPVFVAGRPRLEENPVAAAFDALPLADRFNHRARVWLLGQLVVVVVAARGANRLGRWAPAAAAVVVGEVVLVSPARVPLPGVPAGSPEVYAALAELPDGPVAVEGAVGPGVNPQRVLYDQRAHGRRLLVDPNRPGPAAECRGCVVVALGAAARLRTEARLGPPTLRTGDDAAWWVPPTGAGDR